jgi:hypothetical protein
MKTITKISAILIFGIVALILSVIFFTSPVLDEVNIVNAQVKQKQIELLELHQQIVAFKNAQADLAQATRKTDITQSVVLKEDLVIPVQDLEAAINKNAIDMVLQIKEPDTKEKFILSNPTGITQVSYGVTAIAPDFPSLINLFGYIEHMPHITEPTKIILSSEILNAPAASTPQTQAAVVRTGRVQIDLKGVFFIKVPSGSAPTTPPTK